MEDPEAVKRARKPYCELTLRPCFTHVHHIRPKSRGGDDIPENLISLAPEVHAAVHDGRIDRYLLVQVVAKRKGLSPEEVCERIGLPVPEEWPTGDFPGLTGKEPPSLEEVLQVVLSLEESQDDAKWLQGEILAVLVDMGFSKRWLAHNLRRSLSYVKNRVRTWRTFPEPHLRCPELTWEHHKVAALTPDPAGWLERAAENGWSTRQLQLAIAREKDPERAEAEEERRQQEAERLLEKVLRFVEEGGPQGAWLRERLLEELG